MPGRRLPPVPLTRGGRLPRGGRRGAAGSAGASRLGRKAASEVAEGAAEGFFARLYHGVFNLFD